MMSNLIINVRFNGTGLLSKLLLAIGTCINKCKIKNIKDTDKIKSIKIVIFDDRFPINNMFDYIYSWDASNNSKSVNFTIKDLKAIKKTLNIKNIKANRLNLKLANKLVNKNIIKPKVLESINRYINKFNISNHTLGIHIRLTDMNKKHAKDYGKRTYRDFLSKIKEVLRTRSDIKNLFVASDNHVSIVRLKADCKNIDIFSVSDCIRNEHETSEFSNFQLNHISDEKFIIDSFIDMYLLSKCGYLIHRISGFACCAIIYSNSLKETFQI
jgi:hypothetical protein